jgi:hypothetical protein
MVRVNVPFSDEAVSVVFQSVTFMTTVNPAFANGSIDAVPVRFPAG